ncbi:MAG: hypothetical protein ACTSXW_06365 [Candidatus Baldrarchaeia archaeon]
MKLIEIIKDSARFTRFAAKNSLTGLKMREKEPRRIKLIVK